MIAGEDTNITVRLEPRTKFFAVLQARRAGLTLSEFVQSCVESCLQLDSIEVDGQQLSYEALQDQLWTEHPADRYARLAYLFPNELTVRERKLWNSIIRKSDEFWHVQAGELRDIVTAKTFRFDRLRERWAEFEEFNRNDVAALAKTVKQQQQEEWSSKAIPQQRALVQEQQNLIKQFEAKPARKRK